MKKLILYFIFTVVVWFSDGTVRQFPDGEYYKCKDNYCYIYYNDSREPVIIPSWQIKLIEEI
jgi:hypothetical protein